ncbi:hypothetical protein FHS56_001567 [Thermonema lapsum]|uniref:Uncharacterized protein n=1 Tax=Thermonema lapsum TaxID=28195 RepID=A0A846MR44_9BACT|nr:hypothetical protein [Thermonema lapsum]NIK74054.1 hypothetical protein [Thermonema lapsum]
MNNHLHPQDSQALMETTERLFHRDFDVPAVRTHNWAALHQAVCEVIDYYLQRAPERFFQIMYRLDVDEKKVKDCLAQGNLEALAAIIIEREKEKAQWRLRYPSRSIWHDDDDEAGH